MENEELETTDSNEEVLDAEEESAEETINPVGNEEPIEEPEKVKSLKDLLKEHPEYQDEMNDMMKDRAKRERNAVDRDYRKKLAQYEELAYLTQEGLKADSLDDALNKSREFYNKQGIKYIPKADTRDEEILATADAQEIIDECDSFDDLRKEADKLIKKGTKISSREQLVLDKLVSEMEDRKRLSDLRGLGVKEEVYNSNEFKEFSKLYAKTTPVADIYKMYQLTHEPQKKVLSNPGSMKTIQTKEKKGYITEKEFDNMTEKEIEENMDLIRESMSKW